MSFKPVFSTDQDFFNPDKNQDIAVKLFNTYYRSHNRTGKVYESLPDMFLVKPEVLAVKDLAVRNSDKFILEECIQEASLRSGHVNVSKHYDSKLNFYWLELNVSPYMLGDPVNEGNKSEYFYLLTNFIEYVKVNPKVYGDLMAEIDSDKDLGLMLREILKMGEKFQSLLTYYPEKFLVSFNPKWPPSDVNKLLLSLKGNELGWCEVFAESLIYVMGRKS